MRDSSDSTIRIQQEQLALGLWDLIHLVIVMVAVLILASVSGLLTYGSSDGRGDDGHPVRPEEQRVDYLGWPPGNPL